MPTMRYRLEEALRKWTDNDGVFRCSPKELWEHLVPVAGFPASPQMSIGELQHMVGTWADRVFPDRSVQTTLAKLVLEEVPEFLHAEAADPEEYADLLILILDLAHQQKIDAAAAAVAKHQRNLGRVWAKNRFGVYHNIGRTSHPPCKKCSEPHGNDVECKDE